MSLEKIQIVDKMEIIDAGDWKSLQVRTATIIKEDGVELSRSFLRKLILLADDWSAEEDEVKTICNAIMTTERINAYKTARAAETPPGAPE